MSADFLSYRGLLRKIVEEDGVMLISFIDHSSYFTVSDKSLYSVLRDSLAMGQPVGIFYDADMRVQALG